MHFSCLRRIHSHYDLTTFPCLVKELGDNNGGPSSAVENSLLSPEFDPLDL